MRKKILVLSPTPFAPANFGNRVRVKRVIDAFIERGHAVDFLYYPGESDWRQSIPSQSYRAMVNYVDNFFISPVTRPLHSSSLAKDHLIDEWWDESIGAYISWLFKVNNYDCIYVNYTWLCKAFEYVPKEVFKILDTHDRFSNRRELLESLSIPPEFFHTTKQQESLGLERADLVLSIKKQEEFYFKEICKKPVLTLIHSNKLNFLDYNLNLDFYKFGIFAASNNINRVNILNFLEETSHIFLNTLPSFTIDIYGSICSRIEHEVKNYPWVKLYGYVNTHEEFYKSVDVALVPISASTGLKIKAAEAFSFGIPIIGHQHAFEGLPIFHNSMRCKSFKEIGLSIFHYMDDPIYRREVLTSVRLSAKTSELYFDTAIDSIFASLSVKGGIS